MGEPRGLNEHAASRSAGVKAGGVAAPLCTTAGGDRKRTKEFAKKSSCLMEESARGGAVGAEL